MKIVVNGTPHEATDNATVAQLLAQLELTPRHVAVEVNAQLVPREQHANHVLREDDQLEVVTFVGGG